MSEEAAWKKISDKKYQRLNSEGEWVTVDVPYGKVEMVFDEFIGAGGLIDPASGAILGDMSSLVSKFKTVGNVILTEFDAEGEIKKKGNCLALDPNEIPPLFEIAVDIIETFSGAISKMKKLRPDLMAEQEAPVERKRKAKE